MKKLANFKDMNSKKKKFPLHLKILIGMLIGVVFGLGMTQFEGGKDIIIDWVKPWGTIFVNLLKLIAIPLIVEFPSDLNHFTSSVSNALRI